jgi:hypothetical protein
MKKRTAAKKRSKQKQSQKQSQKVEVNVTIAQPKSKRTRLPRVAAAAMPLQPTTRLMSTYAQAPPISSSFKQAMGDKPDVRGNQTQLAGDWTQATKANVNENNAKAVHRGVKMEGDEPPMATPSASNLNAHVLKGEMENRLSRSAQLMRNSEDASSSTPPKSLVKNLVGAYEMRPPPEEATPTNKLYPVAKLRQYVKEKNINAAPYGVADIRKFFKLPENADLDLAFRKWWKVNP